MGMVDQVLRTVETEPLQGKLREVEVVLARVGATGGLSEDEALDAIARIVGSRASSEQTYQKPLG